MSQMNGAEPERCDASQAIVEMTQELEGTIILTMAPGWDHVLPNTFEEDPGVLIMWEDANLEATVANFNAAVAAGAAVAPPYFGAAPFTVAGLKTALLAHMQDRGGGGGVVGNALIAPNTIEQYGNVRIAAALLGSVPFVQNNAVAASLPIGRFYILKDRQARSTASPDPIAVPLAGFGVPLFQ